TFVRAASKESAPRRASKASAIVSHARRAAALTTRWSRLGRITNAATVAAAPARTHPITRSGIALAGPGMVAPSTKAVIAGLTEAAYGPPKKPMKRITETTRTVLAAASHGCVEGAEPSTTSTAPTAVNVTYARARGHARPPKSAKARRENDPKAANVAAWRACTTSRKKANTRGVTTEARTARRRATAPGSRALDHAISGGRGRCGGTSAVLSLDDLGSGGSLLIARWLRDFPPVVVRVVEPEEAVVRAVSHLVGLD